MPHSKSTRGEPDAEVATADGASSIPFGERPGRLTITSVSPSVRGGAYPAKRVAGDIVEFRAIIVCDSHMELGARLLLTSPDGRQQSIVMERQPGYTFVAKAAVTQLGVHEFAVEGWVDHAATLQSKITRKQAAGQATDNEDEEMRRLGADTTSDHVTSRAHRIVVDRELASFAAWYEFFPRSTTGDDEHGTLRSAIDRLDYVRDAGFDIVYLPPVHPIGENHRKGRNNTVTAEEGDVGSPWAIGSRLGGHCAIHPDLGTIDDFDALVAATEQRGLELAMDIAFQCAPDHPWVSEHPEWFSIRPDGTIAYAENPPKRYQDIVPFNFDSSNWRELWQALSDVVAFWRRHGVRTFRVDNPHTKSFAFWEWMIAEHKREDPGLIFLAEAFAHPDVMFQLSRIGFSVSYTHFPWQHETWQLQQYFDMLLAGENIEFFRGSAWVNTPDILTAELQQGVRQAFESRLVLAATLSANYGVYGPTFELMTKDAVAPGSEEYRGSEKYEVRSWDLESTPSLRGLMAAINRLRGEYSAFRHDRSLVFHESDNPRLLVYSKTAAPRVLGDTVSDEPILVVVNTDHWNVQEGLIHVDLDKLGGDIAESYQVVDLLTGEQFTWHGWHNYVRLDPWQRPAHVFAVKPIHDEVYEEAMS